VLVNPQNGEICSLTTFDGYEGSYDVFGEHAGGPLVWSPDGSALAIIIHDAENAATELYVWSRLGLAGPLLQVDEGTLAAPSWAPDGSQLVVSADPPWTVDDGFLGPASVWIVSSDGAAARVLEADCTACGGSASPHWSPSGDRIAMLVGRGPGQSAGGVSVASADGSNLTHVSGTIGTDRLLGWANEGSVRVITALDHLLDVPLDSGVERIDHGVTAVGYPSPDGTRVAQIPLDDPDGVQFPSGDLMICELGTTNCDLVAEDIPAPVPLWWSPDGQTIGYLMNMTCGPCPSAPLPPEGIWLVNVDGTGHRQLTNALWMDWNTDGAPVWQPRP
jgi:Tol biopolymer transport system component